MASDLDKIAQREQEIARTIEALKKEADELAVARMVVSRLNKKGDVKSVADLPSGAPRPAGIPTTFDMTESVLADAEKAGKDGLTSKELIEGIREKYWPGLKRGQILPTIYGFYNDNRLHRTAGGKWKRLKKAEK